MRLPVKLSSIDQEHLQELYDAAGVARDELPYSEAFETLWQGFQDRTFKNAEREQVFAALLKYTRSGGNAATEAPATKLTEEQLKTLKALLPRFAKGTKVLPYSDEFDAAMKEFTKATGVVLTGAEFWQAMMRSSGPKRRPPKRAKAPAVEKDDDSDDE